MYIKREREGEREREREKERERERERIKEVKLVKFSGEIDRVIKE